MTNTNATATRYAWISANGTFTVESPRGAHRTYRVRTAKDQKDSTRFVRIVGVLVGTNNETDFDDFAILVDDGDRGSSHAALFLYKNRREARAPFPVFRVGRSYSETFATARRRNIDPSLFGAFEKHAATVADVLADDAEIRETSLLASGFTVEASRTCRRCNRKLTTPESIRDGIGPECASKEGLLG